LEPADETTDAPIVVDDAGARWVHRKPKKIAQLIAICRELIAKHGYENPGFVVPMSAVRTFREAFRTDMVVHFGGQRGSNHLKNCDGGFVVGTYQPPDDSVMQTAMILNQSRLKPFHTVDVAGNPTPIRTTELMCYEYWNEVGEQAHRNHNGLWDDPDLRAVAQALVRSQMEQAVGRFRTARQVWLLSSYPTTIPLTGFYHDPPIHPPQIGYRTWLRIVDRVASAETITIYDLAEWAGVTREWVSRNNWLGAIMEYYAPEWEAVKIGRRNGIGRGEG
jgi:hypothetical protein